MIAGVIALVALVPIDRNTPDGYRSPTPTDTPSTSVSKQSTEVGNYTANWISVTNASQIKLYSNLSEGLTSKEAADKYSCGKLVNAGFYTKESTHLGLFKTDGQTISNSAQSTLLNGFFYVDQYSTANISKETPPASAPTILQSGPVLLFTSQKESVVSKTNEQARRMVVGTGQKGIYFIVFYSSDSVFEGPTLSELPEVVANLDKKASLELEYALNLDGGTASAFLTPDTILPELTPIGGFFCIE